MTTVQEFESDACPFCTLTPERVVYESDLAVAIFDGFPVSPGHMLVIPKRHIPSCDALTEDELLSIMRLVARCRVDMSAQVRPPHGFNVGINDGKAAGQTVMHLHVHVIPRYEGDLPDPRGGIRWVLPKHADYWSQGAGPVRSE